MREIRPRVSIWFEEGEGGEESRWKASERIERRGGKMLVQRLFLIYITCIGSVFYVCTLATRKKYSARRVEGSSLSRSHIPTSDLQPFQNTESPLLFVPTLPRYHRNKNSSSLSFPLKFKFVCTSEMLGPVSMPLGSDSGDRFGKGHQPSCRMPSDKIVPVELSL